MTMEIQRYRRGVVGWIVAIIFWGFNVFMLAGAVHSVVAASIRAEAVAGTAAAGQVAYTNGLGLLIYGGVWFLVAATLGLMMHFTRSSRVIGRRG